MRVSDFFLFSCICHLHVLDKHEHVTSTCLAGRSDTHAVDWSVFSCSLLIKLTFSQKAVVSGIKANSKTFLFVSHFIGD